MSALELFRFPGTGQQVRTVLIEDEPWLVARDVCDVLGLSNITEALRRLDEDEFTSTEVVDSAGRRQRTYAVNEPGLYGLVLASRKPGAKEFKRWVKHEVLPAIRKTGRYEVPALADPLAELERQTQMTARAIEIAKAERARADLAEQRAYELEPAAHAWDVLASAHGDYSVREAAFILNRDPSISTGQKRLFQALRDLRLIDSRDIPYAAHERHVTLRSRQYEHPHTREPRLTQQVRITVDGLRYLHKRLGGSAPFSSLIGDAA